MKKKCLFILFLFVFTFFLSNAHSDTIVSVGLGIQGAPAIGGQANQYLMMSWTASQAFTDVVIDAYVFTNNSDYADAIAYLTTQVGPGATSATLIASNNITLPYMSSYPSAEQNLFSGLNLDPGTYYLILAAFSGEDEGENYFRGWLNGESAVTAPGVTVIDKALYANWDLSDTVYPPASDFSGVYGARLAFDVTGTPVGVPEPTTMLLLGSGLLGLWGLRRKFKK